MANPSIYLLDTAIVVHLIRDRGMARYLETRYGLNTMMTEALISVVSLGEVMSFARQRSWGQESLKRMRELLAEFVQLDINVPEIIEAYAEIDAASLALGHRMGKNDVWIAATARILKIPLLTSDKDFDHLNGNWLAIEWVDPVHGKNP